MPYVFLTASESGRVFIDEIEDDKVDAYLAKLLKDSEECDQKLVFRSVQGFDPEHCSDGERQMLVIKGKVVMPRPAKVVERLTVE